MSNPADEFLLGSGGTSAKFESIGDRITGTIVSTAVQQQTDITSGAPLTWDNGDPRQQLVVRLQTEERDPAVDNDDDIRAVYVKGSKKTGSQSMHDAVASAVRAAGGKGLEEGGTLTVEFIGEEPPQQRGLSPRKLWRAVYAPPDRAAASGSFLGTAQAPEQFSASGPTFATPAPTVTPGAAPTMPQMTPEQIANYEAWKASQQPR